MKAFLLAFSIVTVFSVTVTMLQAEVSNGTARPRVAAHDPSTIVRSAGKYWLFSTGWGISSRSSENLLDWTEGPRFFKAPPRWTTDSIQGNKGYFWAPDVVFWNNNYHLYYSVSTFGKNRSAIGLTTSPSLDTSVSDYDWTDRGLVIESEPRDDHNAIDPSVLPDREGRLWMAFGSFWNGIKLVELNPVTGLRLGTNTPLSRLAWHPSIEAACLTSKGDFYYLFVNWGTCCQGTNSTYEIRVGRSRQITGPYLDREGVDMAAGGGTPFLGSAGARVGPGHAGILRASSEHLQKTKAPPVPSPADPEEYFSYHYYDAERGGRGTLGIMQLRWTVDGWPQPGEVLK